LITFSLLSYFSEEGKKLVLKQNDITGSKMVLDCASDCSGKPRAVLCVMFGGRGGFCPAGQKTPEPHKHSKVQAGLERKARPGAQKKKMKKNG
jgi:hypothetical protein